MCCNLDEIKIGKFHSIEKHIFGSQESRKVYFKIGLLQNHSKEQAICAQIILFSKNSSIRGTFAKIILRSFTVICNSFSQIKSCKLLAVPGGGTAELTWAKIWQDVGLNLQQQKSNNESCSVDLSSIVSLLSGEIKALLIYEVRDFFSLECSFVCDYISSAYYSIAYLHFNNCYEVLRDSTDISLFADSCGKIINQYSKRDLWIYWNRLFDRRSSQKIGILATLDESVAELCFFGDSLSNGVFCSLCHFISLFISVMQEVQFYLRLDFGMDT
jgi:hypothetical protein